MTPESLLVLTLEPAVLLRILELHSHGGPTAADFARVQAHAQLITEKGDVLQFGGGKKGEPAQVFNALADALSVMAFLPGGVEFAGLHFEEVGRPRVEPHA